MERNLNEKMDTLMTEVVKVSIAVGEVSKEVHAVNNKMAGIEAVLNGINGNGGVVRDLSNMGDKLSRLGNDHNNLKNQVTGLDMSHKDLKDDVRENKDKIKTLFIETNNNRIASAGISSKVATIMTVISAAMATVVGLAMKYLEMK